MKMQALLREEPAASGIGWSRQWPPVSPFPLFSTASGNISLEFEVLLTVSTSVAASCLICLPLFNGSNHLFDRL